MDGCEHTLTAFVCGQIALLLNRCDFVSEPSSLMASRNHLE
jgi:hypothetical protein